jgi:hypothetical protein
MQHGSRLLKLLRPEVFVLVVLPTVSVVLLALLGVFHAVEFGAAFWTSLLYLKMFGWEWSYLIGGAAVAYLAFSVVDWAIQRKRFGPGLAESLPPDHPARRSVERLRVAASLVGVMALYAYACIVHFIALNGVCTPSYQRVNWTNELLMRADYAIFGSFVPFEAQELPLFHAVAKPLMFCYTSINQVIMLVLLALCVFNYQRCRQFALSFFVVTFLALPGWYALPAICPDEAYRLNIAHVPIPLDIALETASPIVHLNHDVARFLAGVEPVESDPANGVFLITCFPSMHVAWGALAAWYGCMLYSRLAILLIPWAAMNAIAAVVSLQHYAVDAIAGLAVAVVTVLIVRWLMAFEARRGLSSPRGYEVAGSMRSDVLAGIRRLRDSFMPLACPKQSK